MLRNITIKFIIIIIIIIIIIQSLTIMTGTSFLRHSQNHSLVSEISTAQSHYYSLLSSQLRTVANWELVIHSHIDHRALLFSEMWGLLCAWGWLSQYTGPRFIAPSERLAWYPLSVRESNPDRLLSSQPLRQRRLNVKFSLCKILNQHTWNENVLAGINLNQWGTYWNC